MKKIMIIAAAALLTVSAMAQDSIYNHNLQVTIGGGMNTMLYQPTDGKAKLGGGALLQVKYEYMFSEHWGVGVGAGLSSLNSSALFNYKDQAGLEAIHPDNGEKYTPYTTMNNLREVQNMISIDIPVQAIWRHQLTNQWGLEAGLGVSLNMPVWLQYKLKSGSYGLAGYFESIHGMVQNLENHGFTQIEAGEKGQINHNAMNVGIQGDFGVNYQLRDNMALYCGLYLDGQMLNTIEACDCEKQHIDANTLTYTATMHSVNVDAVHPIELGVKVGLSFGVGEKKPTKAYAAYLAEQQQQQRLADEEAARIAAEKAEQDRLAREAAAKAEAERLAREKAAREAAEKAAAEEAAKKAAEEAKQRAMIASIQGGANFKSGSVEPIFSKGALETLDALKQYLAENPDKNVYLTGHTDNTGSADGNMRYGQKRADAYKNALVKQGVDAARIFTESKGQTQPIADNSTEEGRAKNRRVEMDIR